MRHLLLSPGCQRTDCHGLRLAMTEGLMARTITHCSFPTAHRFRKKLSSRMAAEMATLRLSAPPPCTAGDVEAAGEAGFDGRGEAVRLAAHHQHAGGLQSRGGARCRRAGRPRRCRRPRGSVPPARRAGRAARRCTRAKEPIVEATVLGEYGSAQVAAEHHAGQPVPVGQAQQRAQVAGVAHFVESQHQGAGRAAYRAARISAGRRATARAVVLVARVPTWLSSASVARAYKAGRPGSWARFWAANSAVSSTCSVSMPELSSSNTLFPPSTRNAPWRCRYFFWCRDCTYFACAFEIIVAA
jgi:hypothetical protein